MSYRRGISLLEIVVSVAVLGAMMTMTVQVVAWSARSHRVAANRQWAVQELANQMEQLAALPWDELTPDRAAALRLSEQARTVLQDAEMDAEIAFNDPDSEVKRISFELRWCNDAGELTNPVRLTTWVNKVARVR